MSRALLLKLFGAFMLMAVVLAICFALSASFHLDDRSEEFAIADEKIVAQNAAFKAARLAQILQRECLKEKGPGAWVIWDENGNFKDCGPRWGRAT